MKDISGVLAEKLATWFQNKNSSSEYDQIVVKYGLELLIESMIKLLFLIVIAVIMNKVLESLMVMGVFSLLRLNAGGFHMKSSLGCTLGMFTVWTLGVFGSKMIPFSNGFIIIFILFTIVLLYRYAPCDTTNNPITDQKIRNKKKVTSIIFVSILAICCFIIKDSYWKGLIILPIMLEIITILPIVNYINQKRLKEDM